MNNNTQDNYKTDDLLTMTSSIVSSFVSANSVEPDTLPDLIKSVHRSLKALNSIEEDLEQRPDPAVPVGDSITPDHIICLEDGRKLKMLKRYLRSRYDMTPEDYRTRWELPVDYPMVAPNYAKKRSSFAKEIGLGQKRKNISKTS